ncbi:probable E3 SUMO-protein ligase RNF212 [Sphaerodactylus townsendi]|uniref:probable E3 SUMO-protein ligase RNF212 n=1 Tax=Sphaerodactylus townsendi TaxID=933632 RepID=UPI00202759C8|nr:probable E3 SUMO-protein ligase RNF212 [Sphaerodactylus townsendi]
MAAAGPLFCNACFQKPPPRGAAPAMGLTSCGHVVCRRCLPTDSKDVCVICRVPCRIIMLSDEINSDIKSLFMRIDGLCKKYSTEVSQISQFQEKHRGRLLTYYRGKIAKLEGCWKVAQQRHHRQHQQHLKSHQEATPVPSTVSVETPVSKNQNEYTSYLLRPTHVSTTENRRNPSMEVDYVPTSVRKIERVARPRISLISPPQNGHMGSISSRSSRLSGMAFCQNSTSESVRSTPLRMPSRETPCVSQIGSSQNNKMYMLDAFGLGTLQQYRRTPASSLSGVTKYPISLADLLQKQHLGATSLG